MVSSTRLNERLKVAIRNGAGLVIGVTSAWGTPPFPCQHSVMLLPDSGRRVLGGARATYWADRGRRFRPNLSYGPDGPLVMAARPPPPTRPRRRRPTPRPVRAVRFRRWRPAPRWSRPR